MKKRPIDMPLLVFVSILVIAGFIIFLSAALGITASSQTKYSSIVFNQLVLGLICGGGAALAAAYLPYMHWRKWSFWMFIASIIVTLAVFIPGLGMEAGGATRWLRLGPISFQPSEFLKIAFVLYFATWISMVGKKGIKTWKFGFLPFVILATVLSVVMLAQPDTDTLVIMLVAGAAMYFVAGGPIKHFLILGLVGVIGLSLLILSRPYLMDRIMTFVHPTQADEQGSGYQIRQSLIAIGSGGFAGRGFGQSLQKFNYLPEPIGDSIYAVAAEEFGFLGACGLIILFFLFAWRGLKIASRVPDTFGGLVAVGLVILITTQSFWNIAAMLGVIPLSGLPLLFVSHGGTALFFTLVATGILLNISRYQKTP
ncbi:MAG: stage sporulation protein [Candidatus Parcubacteria bacterium]|jgi:cell division protein FtsW